MDSVSKKIASIAKLHNKECSLLWFLFFFFSSRRRHTRLVSDWSSDVCSSDLEILFAVSIRDDYDLSVARNDLEQAMRRRRHLRQDTENDFEIIDPSFLSNLWDQQIGRASCRERV